MQELAVLASGALAAQHRFNTIADNVANANTNGFHRLKPDFQEMVSGQSRTAIGNGTSYVADRGLMMDTTQGTFNNTGNAFDMAIAGNGYFGISVNGTTQYTRRGQFVEDAQGQVVTPDGHPLLDNSGSPIQLPIDANEFRVAPDGTVSTEQGTLGQIGIYDFTASQEQNMVRAGNTNFIPHQGDNPTTDDNPNIKQGTLETSNVNAVQEMVDLNAASQSYQNSINLLQTMESTETNAIQTLGKQ